MPSLTLRDYSIEESLGPDLTIKQLVSEHRRFSSEDVDRACVKLLSLPIAVDPVARDRPEEAPVQ